MKLKIFVVLTIILALACGYLYFFPVHRFTETVTINKVPEETKDLINAEVERLNQNLDKKGFEHTVFDEVQNVVQDPTYIRDSARKEFDSVLNLLNIERKQFKEYRKYAVHWADSMLLAVSTADSSFRYKDERLDLEFIRPKDNIRQPYFNYSYNASVNYVEYWKKKNFLSPKKHYIDFWIDDPRAKVNGVSRIKIQPRERTSFDLGVTAMHLDNIYTGPEFKIDSKKWDLSGSYLYNPKSKKWTPSVKASYNLLSF